jgi:hypothetical protein
MSEPQDGAGNEMQDVPEPLEPNPCRRELEWFVLAVLLLLGLAAAWRGLAPWLGAGGGGERGAAGELGELCAAAGEPQGAWEEQARREASDLAGYQPGPAEQALIEAWQALNLREAGAAPGDPSLAEANAGFAGQAAAFVAEHGWEAWRRLGLHLKGRFLAVLGALQARAGTERAGALLEWAGSHPREAEVLALQAAGGDYLAHAAEGERRRAAAGARPAGRHLPGVLFQARWYLWTRDLRPPEMGLTRQEYLAYLAWKASGQEPLRPGQALQVARELERVAPGGQHAFREGCSAALSGRTEAAGAWFRAQLEMEPRHRAARKALELLGNLRVQQL